jgi:hypothetical protein
VLGVGRHDLVGLETQVLRVGPQHRANVNLFAEQLEVFALQPLELFDRELGVASGLLERGSADLACAPERGADPDRVSANRVPGHRP